MDGWKEGWVDGKAGLRIAYSNKKCDKPESKWELAQDIRCKIRLAICVDIFVAFSTKFFGKKIIFDTERFDQGPETKIWAFSEQNFLRLKNIIFIPNWDVTDV